MEDRIPSKRFGEKLRTLRKKHDISQIQLGEMLGTSGSYIGRLEYSEKNPNVAMLLKLVKIFDVSIDVLLRDELDLDV